MLRTRTAAEPQTLSAAYERCRQLHARHGRTYYLATLLLPRWKRRHVHALYGFTRYADEVVDDLDSTLDRAGQAAALRAFRERFFAGLHGAPCDDPVLPAVLHTVRAFNLDPGDFERFLDSMAMDLTRGRVYLPEADLARFGVRRVDLAAPRATPAVQGLLAFEVERAWAHYVAAAPGIGLLAPSSRPCIQVAFDLYGGILDEVEQAGYQVLHRRVAVPRHRRIQVAGRQLLVARAAARAERRVSVTTPGRAEPGTGQGRSASPP